MKLVRIMMLSLLLAGCGSKATEEEQAKPPVVPVKTGVAEGTTADLALRAPATIFPREQANITPRLTGVIRELRARKGDTVSAGALLVTIENRDLTAQREEAEANVADAQANLEKVRQGTLPADIERARGQVETTRALLNQAQKFYDRRKGLFDQGAIPQRDLVTAETDLATAKTNFDVASRSLALLEQQSAGRDIRIAEARVEQARSRVANVTAQIQFTELHAPFAGSITDQFQYPGDLGQPSNPIFTLVDLSIVTARAQVPEADAGRIKPGQTCIFEGGEGTATGRVRGANRAVDAQRRTVEVWCEIANPPASLRAGAFGEVLIQTGQIQNTVAVPIAALQLDEGTRKGIVMVVDENRIAHRREVEVGDTKDDKRIILSGLKAGETIVIEGGYELPDGSSIRTEPGK